MTIQVGAVHATQRPGANASGGGTSGLINLNESRRIRQRINLLNYSLPEFTTDPAIMLEFATSNLDDNRMIDAALNTAGESYLIDRKTFFDDLPGGVAEARFNLMSTSMQQAMRGVGYTPESEQTSTWYSRFTAPAAVPFGGKLETVANAILPGDPFDSKSATLGGALTTVGAVPYAPFRAVGAGLGFMFEGFAVTERFTSRIARTGFIAADRNTFQGLDQYGDAVYNKNFINKAAKFAPELTGMAAGALVPRSLFEGVVAGIMDPGSLRDAWGTSSGDGEETFRQEAIHTAARILATQTEELNVKGSDLWLVRKLAGGHTETEILDELGYTPDQPEYLQILQNIYDRMGDEKFTEARNVLDDGKFSWGRELARGYGIDPNEGMGKFVSGGADAAFLIIVDPFNVAGAGLNKIRHVNRWKVIANGLDHGQDITRLQRMADYAKGILPENVARRAATQTTERAELVTLNTEIADVAKTFTLNDENVQKLKTQIEKLDKRIEAAERRRKNAGKAGKRGSKGSKAQAAVAKLRNQRKAAERKIKVRQSNAQKKHDKAIKKLEDERDVFEEGMTPDLEEMTLTAADGRQANRTNAKLDRIAAGFAAYDNAEPGKAGAVLTRLIDENPDLIGAIEVMRAWHIQVRAGGGKGLSTTDGIWDYFRTEQGRMSLSNSRLGGVRSDIREIPQHTVGNQAIARAKSFGRRALDPSKKRIIGSKKDRSASEFQFITDVEDTIRKIEAAKKAGTLNIDYGTRIDQLRSKAAKITIDGKKASEDIDELLNWRTRTSGFGGATTRLARGLFIHGHSSKTLAVNDVKSIAEFRRIAESGVLAHMSQHTIDDYIGAFLEANDSARALIVEQFIGDVMYRSGFNAGKDAAGESLWAKFVGKYRQKYSVGDQDIATNRGIVTRVAVTSASQGSTVLMVPTFREMAKATVELNAHRMMFGFVNNSHVDHFILNVWAPLQLARIGFIPRASGEELLAYMLRRGPGELIRSKAAASAGEWKRNRAGLVVPADQARESVIFRPLLFAQDILGQWSGVRGSPRSGKYTKFDRESNLRAMAEPQWTELDEEARGALIVAKGEALKQERRRRAAVFNWEGLQAMSSGWAEYLYLHLGAKKGIPSKRDIAIRLSNWGSKQIDHPTINNMLGIKTTGELRRFAADMMLTDPALARGFAQFLSSTFSPYHNMIDDVQKGLASPGKQSSATEAKILPVRVDTSNYRNYDRVADAGDFLWNYSAILHRFQNDRHMMAGVRVLNKYMGQGSRQRMSAILYDPQMPRTLKNMSFTERLAKVRGAIKYNLLDEHRRIIQMVVDGQVEAKVALRFFAEVGFNPKTAGAGGRVAAETGTVLDDVAELADEATRLTDDAAPFGDDVALSQESSMFADDLANEELWEQEQLAALNNEPTDYDPDLAFLQDLSDEFEQTHTIDEGFDHPSEASKHTDHFDDIDVTKNLKPDNRTGYEIGVYLIKNHKKINNREWRLLTEHGPKHGFIGDIDYLRQQMLTAVERTLRQADSPALTRSMRLILEEGGVMQRMPTQGQVFVYTPMVNIRDLHHLDTITAEQAETFATALRDELRALRYPPEETEDIIEEMMTTWSTVNDAGKPVHHSAEVRLIGKHRQANRPDPSGTAPLAQFGHTDSRVADATVRAYETTFNLPTNDRWRLGMSEVPQRELVGDEALELGVETAAGGVRLHTKRMVTGDLEVLRYNNTRRMQTVEKLVDGAPVSRVVTIDEAEDAVEDGWKLIGPEFVGDGTPYDIALHRLASLQVDELLDMLSTVRRGNDEVFTELTAPMLRGHTSRLTPEGIAANAIVDELPQHAYGPALLGPEEYTPGSVWEAMKRGMFDDIISPAVGSISRQAPFIENLSRAIERNAHILETFGPDVELIGNAAETLATASGGQLSWDKIDDLVMRLWGSGTNDFAMQVDEADQWLLDIGEHIKNRDAEGLQKYLAEYKSPPNPDDPLQIQKAGQLVDIEKIEELIDVVGHKRRAYEQLRTAAMDESMTLTTPFIDDHRVRSQFQTHMSGLIPFWFAEEQFLKRWARGFYENPVMLRKAQLTIHGSRNMGFVQKDQYGNDVFVWPMSEHLTGTIAKAADIAGVFGTPAMAVHSSPLSTDLNFILPGVSSEAPQGFQFGPGFAFSMNFLANRFPEFSGMRDNLLGDISANRLDPGTKANESLIESSFDLVMPSYLKNGVRALVGTDSTQLASAQVQAIQYLMANGYGPKEHDAMDQERFLDQTRETARVILGMRSVTSFVFGTTGNPLLDGEAGTTLRRLLSEGEVDYIDAVDLIVQRYGADATAFTVFGTESQSGAPIPSTHKSLLFMQNNSDFIDRFDMAGVWFLPQDRPDKFGVQETRARNQALAHELRITRTPEDMLRSFYTAAAAEDYFTSRDNYSTQRLILQSQNASTEVVRHLDKRWRNWKDAYLRQHPVFAEEISSPIGQVRRDQTIEQARLLIANPNLVPEVEHREQLIEFMSALVSYRDAVDSISGENSTHATDLREHWRTQFYNNAQRYIILYPELAVFYNSVIRPEIGSENITKIEFANG